jgi:putative ABC transport system permease protein
LVYRGLMLRSFLVLRRIDPGFDSRGVLTVRATGGRQGATTEQRAAIVRQIRDALASIPGVESVTAADVLPLTGTYIPYRWGAADAQNDESRYQSFDVETVLPGYFQTMRTPIVAGREFDESDNHPRLNRIIVDEMLAARRKPPARFSSSFFELCVKVKVSFLGPCFRV